MKEVYRPAPPSTSAVTAYLEKGNLYDKYSGEQMDATELYPYLTLTPEQTLRALDLLATDKVSLTKRVIEQAQTIIDKGHSLKESYSPAKSRLALQRLALPLQEKLLADSRNNSYSAELTKNIEAVYGECVDELGFLIELADTISPNDELQQYVEGSLSELTVFMLGANNKTGLKRQDDFVMIPSNKSRDDKYPTNAGVRLGIDFLAYRNDGVVIPCQVKTGWSHPEYDSSILIISLSELTAAAESTPRQLQYAMHMQLEGSRLADEELIERSRDFLTQQIMSYCPEEQANVS